VLSFFSGSQNEHYALFGAGEKVVQLAALPPMEAARLLLQRSPRTITPAEVGASTQEELVACLARHPLMTVLGGVPGAIVSAAPQLQNSQLAALATRLAPAAPKASTPIGECAAVLPGPAINHLLQTPQLDRPHDDNPTAGQAQ
jgi:hypothetical protein